MTSPVILIDLDGTIRDIWSSYRRLAEFALRGSYWPEDWLPEGPSDYWFLKPQCLHPCIKQLEKLWNRKGLHEWALPYPGAVEGVKKLSDYADVFFITSPVLSNEWVHSENRQWVIDNFGMAWLPRLIQKSDKTMSYGNLLIDDKPTITGILQFPTWKHVLYDQPYNRRSTKPRIFNWNRIEEILNHV